MWDHVQHFVLFLNRIPSKSCLEDQSGHTYMIKKEIAMGCPALMRRLEQLVIVRVITCKRMGNMLIVKNSTKCNVKNVYFK